MVAISTVVPTFNNAVTLGYTIEGILAQSCQGQQVIVVDDGSVDNTAEVVKRFPGITYIRQENAGVSAARNAGIQASTGEWVALCDADDVWHPEKLEIIAKAIEQFSDCAFFFHDFFLFKKDGGDYPSQGVTETEDTIFPFFRENALSFQEMIGSCSELKLTGQSWKAARVYSGQMLRWLILGNFILPSAVVFRRALFDKFGGFDIDFRSAEETEYFLRLSKSIPFCFFDLPLTGYRLSDNSLSGNISVLMENGMRALKKNVMSDPVISHSYEDVINLSVARRYGRLGSHCLRVKQRRRALKYVMSGFMHCQSEPQLWKVLFGTMIPRILLDKLLKAKARLRGGRSTPFLR